MAKDWIMRDAMPTDVGEELSSYSPLLRTLLFARGIKTRSDAEIFLHPSYGRDVHDPFLMKDMDRAVERILRAITNNERVVIFGDYDADGIPGAATLFSFFERIGYAKVEVYIPDRYSEKYGLSEESIRRFAEAGTKVLISVDCGITDVYEAQAAQSLGIDVIITDHHLPHDNLPGAYAVINTKRPDDPYPFKYLCGAATGWKLVQALLKRGNFGLPPEWEKELLDLVCISTVADMVSLLGENRVIVKEGLKVLARSPRPGIASLFARARIKQEDVTEDDISFLLGPRINISSRMSHGVDAFNLLTTSDVLLAGRIAKQLEARNVERRETVQVIIDSFEKEFSVSEPGELIVRGDSNWRIGVLGLSANRLMEKYNRPVCLWTINHEGKIKGSIRSDGSVHVMELFQAMGGEEFFADFGGHDHSGGFSLASTHAPKLEERFLKAYALAKKNESQTEKICFDQEVRLGALGWRVWQEISILAPFGPDNPKPVFVIRNVELVACNEFGKDKNHLELTVREGKTERKVTAFFFQKSDYPEIDFNLPQKVDLLVNLEKSTFKGFNELRLRLVDLRAHG